MKKQVLFTGLICLVLAGLQSPVFAGIPDWFNRYDENHDKNWDYNEFEKAQRQWERDHKHHPMSDKELREYYERLDRNRDGSLAAEEARHGHHW